MSRPHDVGAAPGPYGVHPPDDGAQDAASGLADAGLPASRDPARAGGWAADAAAAAVAVALVVTACLVGQSIQRAHHTLHVPWPPLQAWWLPHAGPGTPAAAAAAVAVVAYGPRLAARLPWRALTAATALTAMAWTWSLALVDGWQRGVAGRLTTQFEYLSQIGRFTHAHAALRDFTHHILSTQPHPWTTHIAGHPPGAELTFVALDRLGLGGGAWASAWCITTGASAAAAVLLTVRALGDEDTARRAAPFLALSPGAVWVGASADGYFTAVAAWGLALLALAATRTGPRSRIAALAAGTLIGLAAYLSYGLVIIAVTAIAVLALARTLRPVPLVLTAAAAVVTGFTLAGFSWWQAYPLLVQRYHQGVGGVRPYGYWVWANLAAVVLSAGLAAWAGTRRALALAPAAARRLRVGGLTARQRLALLTGATVIVIAIADLSGMSKAETERIWLPFTTWLVAAGALLPRSDHRVWLALQAVTALAVNHLLLTLW